MNIRSHYFKVSPELQDYVDFAVYFECQGNFFTDRLLPTTYVHMFMNAGSPITIYQDCNKNKSVNISKGWLKCLHETPYGIELGEITRTLSIRFKPCAAYALVLQPMNTISNAVIPAEEMNIPDFDNFHKEFNKSNKPEHVEKIVNDYLMAHLNQNEYDRPRVFCAIDKLMLLKSEATIPLLANEAGVSTKHLNALFDKYIGLSPKKFGNILRFNELLQEITKCSNNDWMSVVEKYGYHDQSHFIHDFKKFTCLTPTEFINDYHFIDNNLFLKDKNKIHDLSATV